MRRTSSEVLLVSASIFLCCGKSFEFEPISSLDVQNHLGISNSVLLACYMRISKSGKS